MQTIRPEDIFVHISVTPEPDADAEAVRTSVEKVMEKIQQKYLGRNNTPTMRREMHQEIGQRLRNLPGVESVRVPQPLTGNAPTVTMKLGMNLNTGDVSITEQEVIEGKPVPRPRWAEEKDTQDQ